MTIQQIGPPMVPPALPAAAYPAAAARPPQAALPGEATSSPAPPREAAAQAVQVMRNAARTVARNLQFSIDEETGRTVISVVDGETGEVIRQIPSEEILAIARAIDRMQGLLFDREA